MDLAKHDAVALIAAFKAGTATPVDAYEASWSLMAALEPTLNAVTYANPAARLEAEASAARWRAGAPIGVLDGVPVTVKDSLCVAGMPATLGSPAYRDYVAAADELPVERLRAAGAIIIGKTNLPEFALEGYTDNTLFGPTGNPLHPDLTPGGSTGGGAASVAAGYAPIALGTDAGGSLRRPAAHCGLVALKTTRGRVPRRGGLPQFLLDFEVVGGITRSLRDTRLLYDVLSGADPLGAPGAAPPDPEPKAGPLRILAVERFGANPLDPAIATSFQAFADRLVALGHTVETGEVPASVERMAEVWSEIGPIHLAHLFEQAPEIGRSVSAKYRDMATAAARFPATRLVEILARVADLRRDTTALFQRWDAVVTPAIAALAWPKRDAFPPVIDGLPVGPRGHAIYTGWVNAAGLPALALPTAPARDGRQIGIQLIGSFGADRQLLALGDALMSVL
jgi:aspartyl-tRNA(Asn)/glutamyl-tRNA(Gln) amidotransferase subunit A